jgi:hypothetical protein
MMNDPDLDELVPLERLSTPDAVLTDLVDRFQSVLQPLRIASHRGIASRKTLSRMRAFSIPGVITSTRHCR